MSLARLALLFLLSVLFLPRSHPAPSPLILKAPGSIDFLKKYGYLGGSSSEVVQELFTQEAVEVAIKQAQRFGSIPETGILDDDTVQLFSSKRCGVPDIIGDEPLIKEEDNAGHSHNYHNHDHHHHHNHAHHRKKRFVMIGQSWNKRDLKFYIDNSGSTLSYHDVVREIQRALGEWGSYGGLHFSQTDHPDDAEISIGFYRGQHGDRNPFDGSGNVLAHAFFPWSTGGKGLPGDVHFDDDEAWSIGRTTKVGQTIDFTTVALHELGHSLGLAHSPEVGSVMNPYYTGSNTLGDDDIKAMYELYDKRIVPEEVPWHDEARRKYDREQSEEEERERRRKIEERKREDYERKRKQEREQREKYEQEKKRRQQQAQDEQKRIAKEREEYEERRKQEREQRDKYEQEQKRRQQQAHDEQKRIWNERKEYEERRNREREKFEQETRRKQQQALDERRREYEKKIQQQEQEENERTRRPIGSTYEGDVETVDYHKDHDPTHRIPPVQTNSSETAGCEGKFDAATYLRGELFFIKEKMLWRLTKPCAVQEGYPTEVHRFFHLLPKSLDVEAMYQREYDSSLVIFSGRQYWVFDGYTLNGPRSIEEYGVPREFNHIDAVISRNNQVHLFSGDRYWSHNDTAPPQYKLLRQASLAISTLKGLPDHLDTALTYDDETYFFKGDRFWTVNWDSKVATLHHSPASDYWLAC